MLGRKKEQSSFKPQKDLNIHWDNFNGGLNSFFKPTELQPNELAQADNLMYIGRGTPTGRWGSNLYNQAGEGGRVRLLDAYYNSNTSTNLLLTITDSGYMAYKNNASYTIIPGASFPSGYNLQSAELNYNTYISGGSQNFIKFDGTKLIPYVGLSQVTNVSVAVLSQASGFNTYSWKITALSNTGETLAYPFIGISLSSLPLGLASTQIQLSWNVVSAPSGVLQGYNVYRGFPGYETLLSSVPNTSNPHYLDTGQIPSQTIQVPTSDTTSGPKAKYIMKYGDRLIMAGIAGDSSRVLISAPFPQNDQFDAFAGGGYCYVAPNDGDDITGLGIAGNQFVGATTSSVILVFKRNSVHRIVLSTVSAGPLNLLSFQVQALTTSTGATSGDTVVNVENDTYYFGTKGLYNLGMEAQYLNQLRTNELSFKVRDYVRSLNQQDYTNATAFYADNKYIISFPDRAETLMYDRERQAFAKWKTPFGISKWLRYFDATGTEAWLAGSTSAGNTVPSVYQFSPAYISDTGAGISKILRTRQEDFGEWSIFKTFKILYVLFRNVRGSVNINIRIEDRTGNVIQTKGFSISGQLGSGGWGNDQWGAQEWGQSSAKVVITGDALARYSLLYKNCRVVQIEVTASDPNSNFEFLEARMTAQPLGDQSLPTADKV